MLCIHLVMISHCSTGYVTDNTSSWITVSYHPKDVIVISSNLLPDPHLSDQFIHPTSEHILQLTSLLDHKPVQCVRSVFAIYCKKALNMYQSVQRAAQLLPIHNFSLLKMEYEHV